MKLPRTFRPEKDLEEKTKELIESPEIIKYSTPLEMLLSLPKVDNRFRFELNNRYEVGRYHFPKNLKGKIRREGLSLEFSGNYYTGDECYPKFLEGNISEEGIIDLELSSKFWGWTNNCHPLYLRGTIAPEGMINLEFCGVYHIKQFESPKYLQGTITKEGEVNLEFTGRYETGVANYARWMEFII